jgi:hypothetical protein
MENDESRNLYGGKKETKCFRFPSEAINELEAEARRKEISLNSLMNSIIMTYLKWGRFVERNGGLSFSESSFSTLIDKIEDITIFEKTGREAGLKTPRRLLMMLKLAPTKENAFLLVDIICESSFSYRYMHRVFDGKHHFLLVHNLGIKMSKWFGAYMQSMFKDLLDLNIAIQEDKDSVSFSI